eukprot:Hpha_TRINITY_DN8403_c0_g1::TRINITY_DN8403_c0_g1_i1::g.34573::m.34573
MLNRRLSSDRKKKPAPGGDLVPLVTGLVHFLSLVALWVLCMVVGPERVAVVLPVVLVMSIVSASVVYLQRRRKRKRRRVPAFDSGNSFSGVVVRAEVIEGSGLDEDAGCGGYAPDPEAPSGPPTLPGATSQEMVTKKAKGSKGEDSGSEEDSEEDEETDEDEGEGKAGG